ncbi:MAG: hypothetical protein HFE75_12495 [Firmicutes bacterium]|nr:hypothetical protein [Bacillota bacterium]NBI64437.1 hypothetical protein [Clostridiales bacterium]
MRNHTSLRSSLLLIELIMAILIFSLAGGMCLQIFAKSHSLGMRTVELDMAVREATSVSEVLSQKDALENELPELYPKAEIAAGSITIYYDKDFQACGRKDACFQMNIRGNDKGRRLVSYAITVRKDSDAAAIYSMETTTYQQVRP